MTPLVIIMNDQVCSMHVVFMKIFQIMSKLLHDLAPTLSLFRYKPGGVCLGLVFTGDSTKFTKAGVVAEEYQLVCFTSEFRSDDVCKSRTKVLVVDAAHYIKKW